MRSHTFRVELLLQDSLRDNFTLVYELLDGVLWLCSGVAALLACTDGVGDTVLHSMLAQRFSTLASPRTPLSRCCKCTSTLAHKR